MFFSVSSENKLKKHTHTNHLLRDKLQVDFAAAKKTLKYEKQYQQGRAALNERNPHTTQQHRTTDKEPSRTQTHLILLV
jgi:hypothetical protein